MSENSFVAKYARSGTLYQQTSLSELFTLTSHVPQMSVKEMLEICGERGVGLGTLHNTGGVAVGEVTVFDGVPYFSDIDGNTRILEEHEQVYFAQVGHFPGDIKKQKIEADKQKDLEQKLLNLVPEEQRGAFLIRIERATFQTLVLRSVDGAKEYMFEGKERKSQNLGEIIANQREFVFKNDPKEFRIAGVYNNPEKPGGVSADTESPGGVHIHAVGPEGKNGGHIQIHKMEGISCIVQVFPIEQWLVTTRERAGNEMENIMFRNAQSGTTSHTTNEEMKTALQKLGYSNTANKER